MNGRVRSPKRSLWAATSPPSKMEERFHRFLRPGALARLRDTRISSSSRSPRSTALLLAAARSHRLTPPSSPAPTDGAAQISAAAAADGSPFFAGCRVRGPRCPQRKKLRAARAVFFVPGSPAGADVPSDALAPPLDQFGVDLLRVRSSRRSLSAAPTTPSRIEERYQRFLRPGALAHLRDTRISSARSPRSAAALLAAAGSQRPMSPSSTSIAGGAAQTPAAAAHGSPFFAGCRVRGPRCPQRKNLRAARAVFFVPGSPAGAEAPTDATPPLDRLSTDLVLAQ
ncbi:hypothetical protein Taro_055481 [Colocasia esculenta]|uniref:Uncharacterized protein n=1 Tax=Colocasia esculenta TaxID=4460 RepID=A0A843XRH8_COLES|nr:hypothetical protein [Colocasia esculenta]